MAINQIPSLRTWVDGQPFSARDYIYERNTVVGKINEVITEVNTLSTSFDVDAPLGDNFLDARYYTETEVNNEFTADRARITTAENDIVALENNVDQDVSIGSNPAFATPTVDGITFRNNGDTSTIDFADAQAVNATAAHIASTANPHTVTATQVGLGSVDNTSDAAKPVSTATQTALDGKQATLVSGTNIKSINSASILTSGNLDLIAASEKAQPNGVATLGGDGKVPAAQLPSFVDDLEEYANLAAFPATGVSDKIFVALDTGKIFRWSGSQYVEIAANEVNSVNNKTGVVVLDKTDIGLGNVANTAQVTEVTATAPIESSGGTTPVISIVAATDAVAGSMSATDKAKLDNLTAETLLFDEATFTGQLLTDPATTNVQDALILLDTHDHVVADITDLSATTVTYDNTGQNLVATDVQAAINEIDDLVEEGLTQVVVIKYTITDADDGTGGFVYNRNDETGLTGAIDNDQFIFPLPSGITYVTGGNRLAVKIDGSDGALKRLFFGADDELIEANSGVFRIDYAIVDNDVLYAKLYQSLATVSLDIADGSVTEAKLANGAVTTAKLANNAADFTKIQQVATNTILGNDTAETANVKALTAAETKVLLALNNVNNTTDLNKPISTNTQTALDLKADKATSAALTANRAIATDGTGKLIVSTVTDTELGHVSGVTSAIQTQLNAKGTGDADVVFLTTTIAAVDWTGAEAPYSVEKTVSGILSTDRPIVDLDLSAVAYANVAAKQADYALIYRAAATDTNEITFFATDEPTEELVIQIKVVR